MSAIASATFEPYPLPLDGAAVTVAVALYDRKAGAGKRYTLLPNVFCERVTYREGAVPPSAQFSYVLDTSDPSSPFPARAEALWPLDASGRGVVAVGKEVVVFVADEAGRVRVLFDGFADAPQIDLAGGSQAVTFAASGAAVRCWDQPVKGSVQRDAGDPQNGAAVPTELPTRFNPDGHPNATPAGFDVNHDTGNNSYPVFLDWRLERSPDPRRKWTLGMFARYLLQTRPGGPAGDLAFVDNPTSKFVAGLDADLQSLAPAGGDTGPIDTSDPSSYTTADIVIDDVLAADRPWPEVLSHTLERHGFALRFTIDQDDSTSPLPEPKNGIDFYRKDGLFKAPPKDLLLQPSGTTALDPGKSNVAELHLVRDAHDSANQFRVVSRPARHEIGVVLAAGFLIDPADALTPDMFSTPALANAAAALRRKYRVYVADEAGDGHWDLAAVPPAWTAPPKPLDLSGVFGKPPPAAEGDPPPSPLYVQRLRPGIDELIAKDDSGKRYLAELAISVDYTGPSPSVWDGAAGTWQSLGRSGWRLLHDRLGIEITADNPNGWKLPNPPLPPAPQVVPGNVVRGVEAQAAPSATMPRFFLKLTCCVEADRGVDAVAAKRSYAPGDFAVERVVNTRDVYRKDAVGASSLHDSGTRPTPWDRDDTADATARARAYRSSREFPAVAGRAVIPWFSLSYRVGDRLRAVAGRGIDLRSNAGAGVGESPDYPSIVAVGFDFSGGRQTTTLELSDHREDPAGPAKPEKKRK